MPSARIPTSPLFTIHQLAPELRNDTLIGAEVVLNSGTGLINPSTFNPDNIAVLRQALYDNSLLVFRKQQGIDPLALKS